MANWTYATLLGRLLGVLADMTGEEAVAILTNPHDTLSPITAAEVVEELKDRVISAQMTGVKAEGKKKS